MNNYYKQNLYSKLYDRNMNNTNMNMPSLYSPEEGYNRGNMFSNLYVFPSLDYPIYWSYIAGILCIIVTFVYYIYIPYKKYPGQTLGKRLMKIKIVNNEDYSAISLKTLIIRQGIGLFLLEGSAIVVSDYLRQMLTLATGFYFEYYFLKIIRNIFAFFQHLRL